MRNNVPFMREINGRQVYFFATYIIPDIEFGPVTDREYAYIFSFLNFAIINIPEFGPLPLRIPLAKFVTYRKYSFLGARFFLISSGPANAGVKFEFFYGM